MPLLPLSISDRAQHRREDLEAVYPEWKCVLSGTRGGVYSGLPGVPLDLFIVDPHHVLGRGKGDKVFSSVLGAVPLLRRIHDNADLHHRHLAAFFLEKAERAVQDAIRAGRYELREEDVAFMEVKREWFLKTFPQGQ